MAWAGKEIDAQNRQKNSLIAAGAEPGRGRAGVGPGRRGAGFRD